MTAPLYVPGDPILKTEPWEIYRKLRDEQPVMWGPGAVEGAEDYYVLSRYDDVAALLRDKGRVSAHIVNDRTIAGHLLDLPALVNRDAPDHTRLRRVTNRALGPRAINQLPGLIQELIDELIADILSKPEVEFVDAFTTELPMRLVGRMLGIQLDRKNEIRRWSEAFLEMTTIIGGGDPDLVPGCAEDFLSLVNFVDEQASARRGCPHQGDLLSDLVSREESGELSHDEVVALGWSFIAAGKDTTMYLLGGGLEMLLTDPQLAERLTAEPERTEDFIEEYLRYYSPTQQVFRRPKEDIELHGVVIPAGSIIHMVVGSANRDPRKFPNPDVFDIDRSNAAEHLAFGAGPHFCPGSVLSKILSGQSFRSLYPHLSRLSLDPARPPHMRLKSGAFGVDHMIVQVDQKSPVLAS